MALTMDAFAPKEQAGLCGWVGGADGFLQPLTEKEEAVFQVFGELWAAGREHDNVLPERKWFARRFRLLEFLLHSAPPDD
jgi:hypothetical protein